MTISLNLGLKPKITAAILQQPVKLCAWVFAAIRMQNCFSVIIKTKDSRIKRMYQVRLLLLFLQYGKYLFDILVEICIFLSMILISGTLRPIYVISNISTQSPFLTLECQENMLNIICSLISNSYKTFSRCLFHIII